MNDGVKREPYYVYQLVMSPFMHYAFNKYTYLLCGLKYKHLYVKLRMAVINVSYKYFCRGTSKMSRYKWRDDSG